MGLILASLLQCIMNLGPRHCKIVLHPPLKKLLVKVFVFSIEKWVAIGRFEPYLLSTYCKSFSSRSETLINRRVVRTVRFRFYVEQSDWIAAIERNVQENKLV